MKLNFPLALAVSIAVCFPFAGACAETVANPADATIVVPSASSWTPSAPDSWVKPVITSNGTNGWSYSMVEPKTEEVKGLIKVEGRPFHRIYTYETETGRTFKLVVKVRKVKDLRPYAVQHPLWVKTQVGFTHWNPVLSGAGSGAGAGVSLYALSQLLPKH